MNKLLLIAISLLFIITSCKKNSEDKLIPSNTISATVDGVNKTFNINATAKQTSDETTGNTLMISGAETSENGSGSINIEINSSTPITPGTYQLTIGVPQGFYPATSVFYVEGYLVFRPATGTMSPNSITITFINGTNVQGTFNAELSGSETSTPPSIIINRTITDGKFNVQIK